MLSHAVAVPADNHHHFKLFISIIADERLTTTTKTIRRISAPTNTTLEAFKGLVEEKLLSRPRGTTEIRIQYTDSEGDVVEVGSEVEWEEAKLQALLGRAKQQQHHHASAAPNPLGDASTIPLMIEAVFGNAPRRSIPVRSPPSAVAAAASLVAEIDVREVTVEPIAIEVQSDSSSPSAAVATAAVTEEGGDVTVDTTHDAAAATAPTTLPLTAATHNHADDGDFVPVSSNTDERQDSALLMDALDGFDLVNVDVDDNAAEGDATLVFAAGEDEKEEVNTAAAAAAEEEEQEATPVENTNTTDATSVAVSADEVPTAAEEKKDEKEEEEAPRNGDDGVRAQHDHHHHDANSEAYTYPSINATASSADSNPTAAPPASSPAAEAAAENSRHHHHPSLPSIPSSVTAAANAAAEALASYMGNAMRWISHSNNPHPSASASAVPPTPAVGTAAYEALLTPRSRRVYKRYMQINDADADNNTSTTADHSTDAVGAHTTQTDAEHDLHHHPVVMTSEDCVSEAVATLLSVCPPHVTAAMAEEALRRFNGQLYRAANDLMDCPANAPNPTVEVTPATPAAPAAVPPPSPAVNASSSFVHVPLRPNVAPTAVPQQQQEGEQRRYHQEHYAFRQHEQGRRNIFGFAHRSAQSNPPATHNTIPPTYARARAGPRVRPAHPANGTNNTNNNNQANGTRRPTQRGGCVFGGLFDGSRRSFMF